MLSVVAALIPAVVISFLVFGPRALLLEAVCVVASVFFEYLFRVLMCGRDNTIWDCSAIVTGLLLAFNLPVGIPLWMAVLGCAVAIIVTKQLFGGIGQNFANPAITARVIMLVAFSGAMTTWAPAAFSNAPVDAATAATPLAILSGAEGELPTLAQMFLGARGGSLGETSCLALLLGFAYLLYRQVITWHTPVAFIGTVLVCTALLGRQPLYQVMAGGLFLGAIFMATDYTTSPPTPKGRLIFGLGCGLITVLIRVWGNFPEGVSFSILLMNILNPYICEWTKTKPFGGVQA